jgi:energy-coupling factor transporter ATP-binding protein EcfA2
VETPVLEGVLIIGPYGSGKSTLAAEMSYLLGLRRQPHALLDLDYLGWAWTGAGGDGGRDADLAMTLPNLSAVTANYLAAGIRWYILAWYIEDSSEVQAVREALGFPMRVARLEVPLDVIGQRLGPDPTAERQENLREAARQIESGCGAGAEDFLLQGDRPVRELATDLLTSLGWPG